MDYPSTTVSSIIGSTLGCNSLKLNRWPAPASAAILAKDYVRLTPLSIQVKEHNYGFQRTCNLHHGDPPNHNERAEGSAQEGDDHDGGYPTGKGAHVTMPETYSGTRTAAAVEDTIYALNYYSEL
jgi:hypothetical protein